MKLYSDFYLKKRYLSKYIFFAKLFLFKYVNLTGILNVEESSAEM